MRRLAMAAGLVALVGAGPSAAAPRAPLARVAGAAPNSRRGAEDCATGAILPFGISQPFAPIMPASKTARPPRVGLLAAAQGEPFQITTTYLPVPVVGQPYQAKLEATGGQPPYNWKLLRPLPAGLSLEGDAITGVAKTGGPPLPPVLVEVEDSSTPPLRETRLLPFGHGGPLALEWTEAPRVEGGEIAGSVRVRNATAESITLTVMVMAVDETNKGFALRYDHEELGAQAATQPLSFAVAMPPGSYAVHVDAVGEVEKSGAIYRARAEAHDLAVGNRR